MLLFFFLNDTATTKISPLSLPAALPISGKVVPPFGEPVRIQCLNGLYDPRVQRPSPLLQEAAIGDFVGEGIDRKSTRLNSSHANISYAVFCLKKKNIY